MDHSQDQQVIKITGLSKYGKCALDNGEHNTPQLKIYSRKKTYDDNDAITNAAEGRDFQLRRENELRRKLIMFEENHKNQQESQPLRISQLHEKIKLLEANISALEELQSSRESELNAEILSLEANIKKLKDLQSLKESESNAKKNYLKEYFEVLQSLLSQIYDTAALSKQRFVPKNNFIGSVNDPNRNGAPTQQNPIVVNALNTSHQVGGSTADSVKYSYTIISDSIGNNNNEPIKIQLAEDGEATDLNCSADLGRVEIVLTPEEKRELNAHENIMPTPQHQAEEETTYVACSEHVAKKRKLDSGRNEVHESPNRSNNHTIAEQFTPLYTIQCSRSNSLLKPFTVENNRSNIILNAQNSSKQSASSATRNNTSSPPPNSSHESLDVSNFIQIGPNGSFISKDVYNSIRWENPSRATRKLLEAVFNRETLATHSLTGKPSPAFRNQPKPSKKKLDPLKVNDIVHEVMKNCSIKDKEARGYITTKCADENKMFKMQGGKQKLQRERKEQKEQNKENINN